MLPLLRNKVHTHTASTLILRHQQPLLINLLFFPSHSYSQPIFPATAEYAGIFVWIKYSFRDILIDPNKNENCHLRQQKTQFDISIMCVWYFRSRTVGRYLGWGHGPSVETKRSWWRSIRGTVRLLHLLDICGRTASSYMSISTKQSSAIFSCECSD